MLQPFGGFLERRGQVEYDLVILPDNDPAVGDAATVKVAMDAEMQRLGLIPGAEKIGMERMDILLGINRAIRGYNELSAGKTNSSSPSADRLKVRSNPAISFSADTEERLAKASDNRRSTCSSVS